MQVELAEAVVVLDERGLIDAEPLIVLGRLRSVCSARPSLRVLTVSTAPAARPFQPTRSV